MKKILFSVFLFVAMNVATCAAQPGQKAQVLALSKKVITLVKSHDMAAVAKYVHPVKGVRFSPYVEIMRADKVFTAGQVKGLWKNKTRYVWGNMDESDELIKMSFAKYYREYVYDFDFARADSINYNFKRNTGVIINNIAKMYPRGTEIEYFVEPTADRQQGSLRLIYEQLRKKWYLVGVVRDTAGI